MNKLQKLLFLLTSAFMMVACSQEIGEGKVDHEVITQLNVTGGFGSSGNETMAKSRSTATGSGVGYQIGFMSGDTIGIFPNGGHQIDFPMTIPDGKIETSTSIIAKGWDTKDGIKYVAYAPFGYENRDASHIFWDYRKIQQQKGHNTRDHLGKYWFLASDTISRSIDGNGNSVFNTTVYNMGAIIRFQCIVPKSADYIRVMFVAPDAVFATHGYYDLFDTKAPKVDLAKTKTADIPIPMLHQPFHALGYTDHVTLDIQSASRTQNKALTGYIAVPEVDLRGKTVTLYLWDADGNLYAGNTTLSTEGYLSRGSIQNILFRTMSPATTLNVKLNDWEKSELCDDCKPVAF